MTRKTDWMSIRMPDGLRQLLKKEAEANHRSMASHVIWILETHLITVAVNEFEKSVKKS